MYKDLMDSNGFIKKYDEEIGEAMDKELTRQRQNLELIASENIVSPAVMAAMGSVLTNKYAEGYPSKRYYGGCFAVDIAEDIARQRACELFGAEHANVQPHSGSQANQTVYFAMLEPGDTVMGMSLSEGGHLTHGSPVNLSGKYFNFVSYGVDPVTHLIDYDKVLEIAKECKPKMIVCGASAYPRAIDFKKFRDICDEVGALLMVDMAHIAGLVAGGQHENPVPYSDFVTTTTHKTLRGPRGGMILCKEKYAKAIDKALFPGMQGGPLMHIIAAKAVCFKEAMQPEFKAYAEQIVKGKGTLEEFDEGYAKLLRGFIKKAPSAKVAVFTPWRINNPPYPDITRIMVETGHRFAIPVYDCSTVSGMYVWDMEFARRYFHSYQDNTHLNAKGHDLFFNKAEKFMLGL